MSEQTPAVPLSETIVRHGLQAASYDTNEAVRMQDVYVSLAELVRDALGVGQEGSTTGLSKLREEFRTADRTTFTEDVATVINAMFDAIDSVTSTYADDESRAHFQDVLYLHLKQNTVPYLRDEVADHLRGTSSTPEIDGAYDQESVIEAYHDAVNIKALLDQFTNTFTVKELRETGFRVKETEKGRRRWDFPTLPNPTERSEGTKRERSANRLPIFTVNGAEIPHGKNFADIAKMVRTEDVKVGARDIQAMAEASAGKNWRDVSWSIEVNGNTVSATEYKDQK